jgi:prepilin-type processing-associated H-X9-DG protein
MSTNNGVVYRTEYEFNSYLCSFGASSMTINKKQNGITDYSVAAYAYDVPYKLYVAGLRSREDSSPHGDGMNVAYLDGHAGWLACKDHGLNYNVEPPGEIGNTAFFRRGSMWGQ